MQLVRVSSVGDLPTGGTAEFVLYCIDNGTDPEVYKLWRDDAGGFGVAIQFPQKYKKGSETTLHPFLPYASSLLTDAGLIGRAHV